MTHRVTAGVSNEVDFELVGAPVAVRTRAADGRMLPGYDLRVETERKHSGYVDRWDVEIRSEPRPVGDDTRHADGVLWLPPGSHKLTANVPGYGKGESRVTVGSGGAVVAAEIVVAPGEWIDLRRRAALVRER